jgi:proton-translocating NADH-quinone oxidoreductase chain N
VNALQSLKFFTPETILLAGAFLALLLDFFVKNKKAIGIFSILVLIVTSVVAASPVKSTPLFFGFFLLDNFTRYFRFLALLVVSVVIMISLASKETSKSHEGEYYSFFLFIAFALILVAASTNLLMIYMSIEFVSVLSYLLVGFLKKSPKAKEAAIKYLLFGSVASGIMLFGMSLLFGMTGSLDLQVIGSKLAAASNLGITLMGLLFIFVGIGFKISMAPFHMWAPDVYEAAPTPVTAFLTVAPKALGFAILIRILSATFLWFAWKWQGMIILLSILTMTIGNITAVSQVNIKRFLAYSSIAQAGYILMGIAVFNSVGLLGVLIYLLAYAFTNLGAFTVVILVSNHCGNDEMASYAGLSKRAPFLAASMTLFLLSLAGLPPLAGFIGKFFMFAGAIQKGFIVLASIAAINSAVAAYYYFKIVRLMYLSPAQDKTPVTVPLPLKIALGLTLIGTIAIGLAPAPVIQFIQLTLAK